MSHFGRNNKHVVNPRTLARMEGQVLALQRREEAARGPIQCQGQDFTPPPLNDFKNGQPLEMLVKRRPNFIVSPIRYPKRVPLLIISPA